MRAVASCALLAATVAALPAVEKPAYLTDAKSESHSTVSFHAIPTTT